MEPGKESEGPPGGKFDQARTRRLNPPKAGGTSSRGIPIFMVLMEKSDKLQVRFFRFNGTDTF